MRWLCAAVCPVQFTGKRGKPSTQAKLFSLHPAATLTHGRKKMSVSARYNTYWSLCAFVCILHILIIIHINGLDVAAVHYESVHFVKLIRNIVSDMQSLS